MRKKTVIMLSALLVLLAGNALANDWFKDSVTLEKALVGFAGEMSRGGYKAVTTAELKGWLDAKEPMLVVDTMPYEASYKKNHIPGAVNFEFPIPEMTEMDEKTKAAFTQLLGPDKARRIVFYCGFNKCTRSHNAAMWARKLGYANVYRHPGGIFAWEQADYPMEK